MNTRIATIMETVKTAAWKLSVFVSCFLFASPVSAQVRTNFSGIALGSRSPVEIALSLISWFLGILAILAVLLVLYGGFLWLFSQGDEEKIQKAKDVLKNALIGMVIILSAWGIVLYVLSVLIGVTGGSSSDSNSDGSGCLGCSVPGGSSSFYVLSTNPEAGETDVVMCTDITVRFSSTIDQTSVTDDNWFLQIYNGASAGAACTSATDCSSSVCSAASVCEGDHVPGTIGFGPGTSTAYINFIPTVDLQPNTVYEATVSGGSSGVVSEDTSADGVNDSVAMSTSYSFTFTTGNDTDSTPPTVQETSSSPFPVNGQVDVCTNTVINFDFSEPMRVSTFNDQTSYTVDSAGTVGAPVAPDWVNVVSLKDWAFGGNFDYAQARPATQLSDNSFYSVRLNGGDANNNFFGAVTDACGNPLDGNSDGVSSGSTVDNYYGYDASIGGVETPIIWETGENAECTPIVTSVTPGYDYYGEYLGKHDGESCTQNSECASGTCKANFCEGYGATTVTINGLYLAPHPEVIMQGSVVYASEDFNTCFNAGHLGNVATDATQGDQCLDDALQATSQIVMRTPVGVKDSPVQVSVANAVSNTSSDNIDVLSPYIATVDPSEGAPGQYITIAGDNFGDDQGTGSVRMVSADGTRVSSMTLPSTCGDVWQDGQIVAVAPETYTSTVDGSTAAWVTGDVGYIQVVSGEGRYSDLQQFVYSSVVRPNLCQIVNSCDAAGGADFSVVGDHFGTTQGDNQVAFAVNGSTGYNATISSWGDTQVSGTTSSSMLQESYWVSVYDAVTGLNSNALSYTIPCNSGPEVVSIASCDQSNDLYPVPNPRPNTTDACINATIGVLFDQQMDTASLNTATIYLQQYNSGSTFNSSYTPLAVTGHFQTTNWSTEYNSSAYYGFQYAVDQTQIDTDQDGRADGTTSPNLQPNTWYQLTITDAVRNTDGVGMSSPYTMRFKTDDTTELCAVSTIDLQPNSSIQNAYWDATLNDISRQAYTGSPYTAQCSLLDAESYSWTWKVDKTDIGNFGAQVGSVSTQNVYVGGNTVANEGTAQVTTSVEAISDSADFTVDLGFCETDSDCASCGGSSCNQATQRCSPVITSIDPADGDHGTWATINGCMFGSEAGNVFWNSTDAVVSAATDWPDPAQCGSTWSDTQIIAAVPQQYDSNADGSVDTDLPETTYNVQVTSRDGDSTESTATFTLNGVVHPGVCKIDPNQGPVGSATSATGQAFGTSAGFASFLGDDDYNLDGQPDRISSLAANTTWSSTGIDTQVPSGATTGLSAAGDEGFKVILAGGDEQCADDSFCSNAVDFVVSCSSNYDCGSGYCSASGVCTEPPGDDTGSTPCTTDTQCQTNGCEASSCSNGYCSPVITSLNADSGPNESATTVSGCYFGAYGANSKVTFTNDAQNTVNAAFLCADSWSDSEIIIAVPAESDMAIGTVADVQVTDQVGNTSNIKNFTVSAQCSSGAVVPSTGGPLLCDVIAATGESASEDGSIAGESVAFIGDNQAPSNQSNLFFDDVAGNQWTYSDATKTSAQVPYGAVTGEVYVSASSCASNAVAFGVECSTAADCSDGAYCISGLCEEASAGSCGSCTVGTSDAVCGTQNGCYYDSAETSYCCGSRPEFVSSTVDNGDVDVCPNTQFQLRFSEEVAGTENILLEEVSAASESATVLTTVGYTTSVASATHTVTVTPITLNTSAIYRLRIPSTADEDAASVRAASSGLTLLNGSETFYFTTASSTCIPSSIDLINDQTGESSYTFTAPDSSTTFTAYMHASDGQLLAPSTDVDWEYTWSPYYDAAACDNVAWVDIDQATDEMESGGATAETQIVTSGQEHDHVTTLTAKAAATAGWSGALNDDATLSTFFCESGKDWQYVDEVGGVNYVAHNYPQHFRMIYCENDGLPVMNPPVITQGSSSDDWFLQYLFLSPSNANQVFSVRVYENTDHLTPSEWYAQNVPNPGSPSETTVDGYQAVRDGLSYYVSASNIDEDANGDGIDELYNNIYLITFNNEEALLQVADQIIQYMRFNWNVSYAACEGSDKDKLIRDTKRIADIGTIASLANTYYASYEEYPEPHSDTFGSYIQNITNSVWSSWQGALGNVLGQTLPEDPYNFFYAAIENDPWNASATPWAYSGDDAVGECEYDADNNEFFDASGTCWDPVNSEFYCPANSHTYLWKVDESNSDNAYLYANMEYDSATTETYITSSSALNPCSDTATSECSCYNYSISSESDPGGEWK